MFALVKEYITDLGETRKDNYALSLSHWLGILGMALWMGQRRGTIGTSSCSGRLGRLNYALSLSLQLGIVGMALWMGQRRGMI